MFSDRARCVAVVGAQWGDEGKGKIVDVLSEQATIVARYQGGANAGHTVRVDMEEFILHLVPSGILYPQTRCLLGNGVVVDPWTLEDELRGLEERGIEIDGRLGISRRAHLVLPYHRLLDAAQEQARGAGKIGTTGRGIGPAYRDKVARVGLRVCDLADEGATRRIVEAGTERVNGTIERLGVEGRADPEETLEALAAVRSRLRQLACDSGAEIREGLAAGGRVLLEGAQGSLLDIDHGTYPYVTSSTTTAGGAAAGVGIGPTVLDDVIGVVKAYTTRVGNGPLPTELEGDEAEHLRQLGSEFGATTGRPRRPGWFDAVVARYAAGVNGLTALAVTKLDVLDSLDELQLATAYRLHGDVSDRFPDTAAELERVEPVYTDCEGWRADTSGARDWSDLPELAVQYLRLIQQETGVPIRYVSVGAGRSETISVA